jgi:hypothetical protein
MFRDYQPKPPGKGGLILWMLATRMDPATGCGWTTEEDLAALAGATKSPKTARVALAWAERRGLARRLVVGRHLIGGGATASLWCLADPSTTGNGVPAVDGHTTGKTTPTQPVKPRPQNRQPTAPQSITRAVNQGS